MGVPVHGIIYSLPYFPYRVRVSVDLGVIKCYYYDTYISVSTENKTVCSGRSDILEWRLGEPVELVVMWPVVLEARRAVLVVATAVEAARRTAGLRVGVVLSHGVGQVPELAAIDGLTVDTDAGHQCDDNNSTGYGELTIQS